MKQLRTIALALLLVIVTLTCASAEPTPARIVLGKRELIISPVPVYDGSRVLLPVSGLEVLGATGRLSQDGKSVSVTTSDGVTAGLHAVDANGAKMIPVDDLLKITGGEQSWDDATRTLSLTAQLNSVEFVNDTLKVNCSFPVACSVQVWGGKLIVNVPNTKLATEAREVSVQSTLVDKARLAQFDADTARIVLDLTKSVGYKLESTSPSAQIQLRVAENLPVPSARVATKPSAGSKTQPYTISGLRVVSVDENRFDLVISTSGRASVNADYGVDPPAVALTLARGTLASGVDASGLSHPLLRGVKLSSAANGTRVSLNLSRIVAYYVSAGENAVTVTIRTPDKSGGSLAGKFIVIDPGHGGREKGARCADVCEKDVNVRLACALADALKEVGARTMLARQGDEVVPLAARSEVAINNGADFFISLHCNSNARPGSATGIETYYHKQEPSARAIAYAVHQGVCATTGMCDRGAKSDRVLPYASGLGVLRRLTDTGIPGILVECGFINHSSDRNNLLSASYRTNLAAGIVAGLRAYVEGTQIR